MKSLDFIETKTDDLLDTILDIEFINKHLEKSMLSGFGFSQKYKYAFDRIIKPNIYYSKEETLKHIPTKMKITEGALIISKGEIVKPIHFKIFNQ